MTLVRRRILFLAILAVVLCNVTIAFAADEEDEDEPKEPSWDELAKENLRLRAELVEANKWVPYQQGSLMRWGKN